MIEFESDAEDWAVSGEYLLTHSSTFRATIRRSQWITVATVAVLMVVAWFALHSAIPIVGGLVGGAWAVLQVPRQTRERMSRHMKKMWAESQAAGVSNVCRLDATDQGVTCTSSVSSGTLSWSAIKRLDETKTHVILSLGPSSPIAIPRARVKPDELGAFVAECRRRIDAQGA